MSIKVRITAWITLMVLLLAAMTLVFVLVMNHNAITDDPAGRLVNVVQENVKNVEFDRGKFEWDDLSMYSGGVYSQFYSTDGALLHGALPEDFDPDLAFSPNIVRTVSSGDRNYFVYDSYVDMDVTGLWVRGIISSDDRSGVMHTITVLTATLLPILLAVTIGGGWLIAWSAMRPVEKILAAVDGISAGEDLSARLNMQRGPREMRRLSAAFDRMFARLEKAFDTERQFTSDASHELRTPITVILAECDRAKRKAYTRDDFLESVGVIEQQSEHMSQLVQALLGLTRMEHGTDKYPIKRMDLSALVCSCCEECPPPPGSHAEVELDIQPDIQAACNAGLMSRVVVNLLQNAYKYGGEQVRVRVSLHENADGKAVLRVADDGPGIAPEDQDKVWQRFWQADPSRGEDGGSGLGLAMVKEIVQLHGGSFGRGGFTGSGPGSRRGLRSAFRSGGHPRHRWRPAWCRPCSFCSCSPCFQCSGPLRWSGR